MGYERETVERFIAGGMDVFEQVVDRNKEKILRLCYRITGNLEDASDVSQETFLKAYLARGRFRGNSSPDSWLYRIAVNQCYDFLKKNRKHAWNRSDAEAESSSSGNPENRMMNSEIRREIRKALLKLPRKQMNVFALRTNEEFSFREIAEILGISEGSAKVNYHFAVKNMREKLRGII